MSEQTPINNNPNSPGQLYQPYGSELVRLEDQHVARALGGLSLESGIDMELAEEIMIVRSDIAAISQVPEADAYIDQYFSDNPDVPELFTHSKAISQQTSTDLLSWPKWLSARATDDQLINFHQWHDDYYQKQFTGPEHQHAVDDIKQQHGEGVARLHAGDYLHDDAVADDVSTSRDALQVTVTDAFDAVMMGGDFGKATAGSNEVEIGEGMPPTALKHEFNHAVLGSMERPDETEPLPEDWLDEAVTDHIAEAMDFGEPDVLDPSERKEAAVISGRIQERAVLAAVAKRGSKLVPAKLFMKAYSAREPQSKAAAFDDLDAALAEAYGSDRVLEKCKRYIRQHAVRVSTDHFGNNIERFDDDAYSAVLDQLAADPTVALAA